MKLRFYILGIILFLLPVTMIDREVIAGGEADAYVLNMGRGFTLGYSFDTGADETFLGNPKITKKMVAGIKEAGFQTLRLPITWEGHFNPKNNMIDDAFLSRLDEVISYALEVDLNIIINMHNDSWKWVQSMDNPEETLSVYEKLWEQIAVHYKDVSIRLAFEALSEPVFDCATKEEQYKRLNQINSIFVETVRKTGGKNINRVLFLPTLGSVISEESLSKLSDFIVNLKDENVVAALQYSGLWGFSVNAAGQNKFNTAVKTDITDSFEYIEIYLHQRAIPAAILECTLLGFDVDKSAINHGEVLKYYEFLTYNSDHYGVPLTFWDTGDIYSRKEGIWRDRELYNMMVGPSKGRSAYADTDRIYLLNRAESREVTLTLTLNNRKLVTVSDGKRELKMNSDYTLSGNKLAFSKEYLKEAKPSERGKSNPLTLHFDGGNDWIVSLLTYDIPSMELIKASVEQYRIPTLFHGDSLVTMEACYLDGTSAGPLEWTTYKEYSYCYIPDYKNEYIEITEEFFAQIREKEEVTLKFHFESGVKLIYKLKKDMSSVSGLNVHIEVDSDTPIIAPIITPVNEETPQPTKDAILDKIEQENKSSLIKNQPKQEEPATLVDIFLIVVTIITCSFIAGVIYVRGRRNKNLVKEEKRLKLDSFSLKEDNMDPYEMLKQKINHYGEYPELAVTVTLEESLGENNIGEKSHSNEGKGQSNEGKGQSNKIAQVELVREEKNKDEAKLVVKKLPENQEAATSIIKVETKPPTKTEVVQVETKPAEKSKVVEVETKPAEKSKVIEVETKPAEKSKVVEVETKSAVKKRAAEVELIPAKKTKSTHVQSAAVIDTHYFNERIAQIEQTSFNETLITEKETSEAILNDIRVTEKKGMPPLF